MANDMHPNSLEAKDLPMKYTQQKEILQSVRKQSATRQELSERLGIPINCVCGRVRELILMGNLYEEGYEVVFHKGGMSKRAILFANK